ncbi:hypothetical protein F8M41_005556 [Gigaspora margarita]|uniref:Uncharacterized protein n=1 Tax=Gigaspora margarita TaxID=4874 RepID=A0A8H3X8M6_GIGMA|nr:hypothetical protein F8M41_005556 [Gigaspora margarita]
MSSPQVKIEISENNETKDSSEDKYYFNQLKEVYNDWKKLQSSYNNNFVVFVAACITSVTIGIVFSISDPNTMGSLSKKIISAVISGLGGTATLLGGLLSLKTFFAKNPPDAVEDSNKEEQELDMRW